MKKFKEFFKDFYNLYLVMLTTLTTLPIIAPILLKLNLDFLAKPIYLLYSFFCHQFASRSIHIYDYQFAWCSRDTGIWLGITAVAYLVKFNKIKGIKWFWAIPFIIPIALDGGLQTIFTFLNISSSGVVGDPIYISNNFARFFTGVLFGIGVSLWLSTSIKPEEVESLKLKVESENDERVKEDNGVMLSERAGELVSKHRHLENSEGKLPRLQRFIKFLKEVFLGDRTKKLTVLFAGLMIVYLFMIQIWSITSVKIKPSDLLDSAVKTPKENFFARREDAICPTYTAEKLIEIECFFK